MTRGALALLTGLLATASVAEAQLTVRGQIGSLDRRLEDAGAVERQTGMVAGGGVAFSIARFSITAVAVGGTLSAKTDATPDVDYARIEADAEILTVPWLVLFGGAEISVFVSPGGAQRWVLPRFGAELRPSFNNLPAYAFVRGSAIVGASTNSSTPPGTSAEFRAGVRGGSDRFQLFAEYELQRLVFATAREEQLGALWLGLDLSF